MAVDHGPVATVQRDPLYRHLRPGHFVIVGAESSASTSWWMGQVVCCEGPVGERQGRSCCHVTDVESGLERRVRADDITQVIWALDGWPDLTSPC